MLTIEGVSQEDLESLFLGVTSPSSDIQNISIIFKVLVITALSGK